MTKIELLAPARDIETGIAAIDAGADAVYIGAPKFGARAAAGNSVSSIGRLCRYAHQFDAKVLVTLNTLLTDSERREASALAWELYEAGADALIVQDLRLLQEDLPPIRLHASTQCDNRTAEDVQARERDGFKRVVLARELGIDEIAAIRKATTVELEAFVHGALCVSYSGRCYMSEQVCGRSANRGRCAQMCRQAYDLLDKDGRELVHGKYVLSLKDMDRSMYVKELLDAGVTTLKIEGRLKDKVYVRNVTAYYRQLLDRLFESSDGRYGKSSSGVIHYDFEPHPEKTFHRGATDYFLHERTYEMANWETPKSTGEPVGVVRRSGEDYIEVAYDDRGDSSMLHSGDGLCYGDKGFMVNRVDGMRIYPNRMPDAVAGSRLYRNYDKEFLQRVENSRICRKLPVDIVLTETEDGFRLRIGDKEREFASEKTAARQAALAAEQIRLQLSKLGNTIYEAREVRTETSQPYFIPASTLNAWRRSLTESEDFSTIRGDNGTGQTENPKEDDWQGEKQQVLMTCRYCILHEMGMCRKARTDRSFAEPRYLRSGKQLFGLEFDCVRCEMRVVRPAT